MEHLTVKDYGARGDGVTDDTAALQAAFNAGHAQGKPVYLPNGVYVTNAPLEIPVETGSPGEQHRESHFALIGEQAHTINKAYTTGGALKYPRLGSVIHAKGTFTAIRTRALPGAGTTAPAYGAELSPQWSNFVSIRDVYVVGDSPSEYGGPTGEVLNPIALANWESVGFDLTGVFFGSFHNLHAEGFGAGLRARNGSELFFTGVTNLRNCRIGALLQRVPPLMVNNVEQQYDLQAWFDSLVTLSNATNLVIDRARSVWINGGENMNPEPTAARRRIWVANGDNTQVHIRNYVIETHRHTTGTPPVLAPESAVLPPIYIDAGGLSELVLDGINYETGPEQTMKPIIECAGHFDHIALVNSALQRAVLTSPGRSPLIRLTTSAANTMSRANRLTVEGNTPAVAEFWISNGIPVRDPLGDVVPAGWQQVCGRPELDESNDNRVRADPGSESFATANVLAGKGRLFWPVGTASGTVYAYFPRALRSLSMLYVTAIVDDNVGQVIPTLDNLIVPGSPPALLHYTSGGHWSRIRCDLAETYAVGARTFRKYAWTVIVHNLSTLASGILGVSLSGIHAGGPDTGIETLNVYADTRRAGPVIPARRMRDTVPSAVRDGAHVQGDVVYNSTPGSTEPIGWVCTAPASGVGVPGTWAGFGTIA